MPPSPPGPPPQPPKNFAPSHVDPLLIAMVGMFCSIFFVFCFHKILQRYCNGYGIPRLFRNSGQRQRLSDGILHEPSLQFQSRSLDSSIMHSLPISQFKKDQEACQDKECAICLGDFEDGEWLKHLSNCSHVFHVSCIDTWFQTHSSCPICRSCVVIAIPYENSPSHCLRGSRQGKGESDIRHLAHVQKHTEVVPEDP